MNRPPIRRGHARVGYISDLAPIEARAVLYWRMWEAGGDHQSMVWSEVSAALGINQGKCALGALERLISLLCQHGRRDFMLHSVQCGCLGADEACFAAFVGYASETAREDAFLMASAMVHPTAAPPLVCEAEVFGLSLRRFVNQAPKGPTHATQYVLH